MRFGFLDVPQAMVPISTGPIGVPILYREASSLLAVFPVEAAALASLLGGTGLVAVPLFQGRPVVVVAMFDYRDTTIGPYHEAALATFVVPENVALPQRPLLDLVLPSPWRKVGLYIFDLPVTTAVANAAGRELWGLPKFVTEIPISWRGEQFDGAVCAPGSSEPLFSLVGSVGGGSRVPLRALVLYSWLQGELLRTQVDLRGWARAIRGPAMELRVKARMHPMAERLEKLGLDGARPALVQAAPTFRARLNLGQRAYPQPLPSRSEAQKYAA
jgi:hypothetical protein